MTIDTTEITSPSECIALLATSNEHYMQLNSLWDTISPKFVRVYKNSVREAVTRSLDYGRKVFVIKQSNGRIMWFCRYHRDN